MSWDFISKFSSGVPKFIERATFFAGQAGKKTDRKGDKAEAAGKRASNSADQDNLKKLENKKKYQERMEGLCAKVQAQVPPVPNTKLTGVDAQMQAIGRYSYSHPYIEIAGSARVNDLPRDAYQCQQYRYSQALEADDRAYKYNNSKEGKAEMKRQNDADNARIRAHYAKYYGKKGRK